MQTHFPIDPAWTQNARYTQKQCQDLYAQSIADPESFWAECAKRLDWIKPWEKVKNCSFHKPVKIAWFEGGKLNVAANCIDRHLKTKANQTAIIWEPDDPKQPPRHISYQTLYEEVCRFANILIDNGIRKGDRVTVYLPMIPEAAYAMLACARIGAIHSVVFAGFSPDALASRILDCDSQFVITADESHRGGKTLPLKADIDTALTHCPQVRHVLMVEHTGATVPWDPQRDISYRAARANSAPECKAEIMDAEDPLFLLYTSGSTGKPKGVLHTTAGYLLYAAYTHETVFNYQEGDIYWCTADIGWVTGHSYIIYGPLANGATTVMFEGIPTWPTPARAWELIDKHQVNIFYTAPTAIRTLMQQGDAFLDTTSRRSLKVLGVVGEPTNPAAWIWYFEKVGHQRCPIVDTWWQTETGGILISPIPGASALKPGSATRPLFGIQPVIVDEKGKVLDGKAEGILCIQDSWPGQARTIYKDHARFENTYFSNYPGLYFTGDGCSRDEDEDYWLTGRVDDVINVSGHRLGTAEIESALVANPAVAEAAVVGYPHDIKGQGIYAFVILKNGQLASDTLKMNLILSVKKEISPIATIDILQFVEALPKTRSGKIMRRILRKIAENDFANLGDISTLADPGIVARLIAER